MPDEEPKSYLHLVAVAAVALVGGMARFADDCARVGGHMGGSADEIARVAGQGDELSGLRGVAGLEALGDDGGRFSGLGAAVEDGGRAGAMVDDAENIKDLAELGLDAADLFDLAPSEKADTKVPTVPHLLVANRANKPAPGRVDPLVILVADDDAARAERVAESCTTLEHRCVVLACPTGSTACIDGWIQVFDRQKVDFIVHPEQVAATLAMSASGPALGRTRVWSGVVTPTGAHVEQLAGR